MFHLKFFERLAERNFGTILGKTEEKREKNESLHFTLLVGKVEGVAVQFYEIAKFTLDEFNICRKNVENYLVERFGGGWFKLNIYDGPTYAMTINSKPKAQSKWEHLIPNSF